jgi:hypothetical protein
LHGVSLSLLSVQLYPDKEHDFSFGSIGSNLTVIPK